MEAAPEDARSGPDRHADGETAALPEAPLPEAPSPVPPSPDALSPEIPSPDAPLSDAPLSNAPSPETPSTDALVPEGAFPGVDSAAVTAPQHPGYPPAFPSSAYPPPLHKSATYQPVVDPARPGQPHPYPPPAYPGWSTQQPDPPAYPGWSTQQPAPPGYSGWSTQQPAPPAPPPGRTHRWGLGAYLLVELVFLLVSALIGVFVVGGRETDAAGLALALAVPTLIAAGTAILITKVRGNGPLADLRLHWSWRDIRLGLAFGFGGLFVSLPAAMIYVAIVGEDATSAVGEVFGEVRASPALAIVIFLTVVFIAPLCEEIVYRGLLWGAVERLGASRWIALIVTTLLFALAHFEFTRTPLLLVVAIPIALARLYTGGLLASIVAHQINNLLPGVALLLGLIGVIPMV